LYLDRAALCGLGVAAGVDASAAAEEQLAAHGHANVLPAVKHAGRTQAGGGVARRHHPEVVNVDGV